MAESETLVFRASLTSKIYRDIEIAGTGSLYALAQAIVRSFDFDFDHAFGFYSKLKGNIYDSPVRYELFVSRRTFSGELEDIAGDIRTFAAIGVHELIFDCRDQSISESIERLQWFATDVIPLVDG